MASIELDGWTELTRQLDKADRRLQQARVDAVQAGGEVIAAIAKQICPRGPDEDKMIPLYATIVVETRDYLDQALAVIGPQYRAGDKLHPGAHAHLVEDGHEIVTHDGKKTGQRATPKPFMRPAFDQTQSEQQAAMQGVVDGALRELGAG